MTSSPRNCVRNSERRRSAFHGASGPSERRYASSRSRRRARRSMARGASSPEEAIGRIKPSPRMSARAPETQPRQLSWATTTVMRAMTAPSPAIIRTR